MEGIVQCSSLISELVHVVFIDAMGCFLNKRHTNIFFNPIEIMFQLILFYAFQTLF